MTLRECNCAGRQLDEAGTWQARLALEFERRGARTVLGARKHDGPLMVQKALYPEGDAVCHTILVHPPGGIAGGDELNIKAQLGPGAHALLTTPGAGKWYRTTGAWAHQRLHFVVRDGAALEWLPHENIFFDGALAGLNTTVSLTGEATFIGWEVHCLGRTGAGETITQGQFHWRMSIEREGQPLWFEHSRLDDSAALQSPLLLAGRSVVGALTAVSLNLDAKILHACREVRPTHGAGAVTLLPSLLVGRYVGASSEAAKNFFVSLWRILRPVILGRDAVEPRIWRV